MERATARLRRARWELERERERVLAEREAFDAFADRVRAVSPASRVTVPEGAIGALRAADGDSRSAVERVVDAYRRTVMDLPHYEEDYGDTLVESVATELGDDVASALCSRADFSSLVKYRTLAAAESARERRDSFHGSVLEEADSLAEAQATLEGVEDALERLESAPAAELSDPELYERESEIDRLRRRCNSIAESRQERLHESAVRIRGDDVLPVVHFYRSLPAEHPVLATVADLVQRLDAVEADVARAVSAPDG